MNDKSLKVLEFYKIIELLTEHATSEPGRIMCRALRPSVVLSTIEQSQQETEDAVGRLLRRGSTNFGSNKDLGFSLKSLDVGSTLSISELLKIAMLLENVARVKNYGREGKENGQNTRNEEDDALTRADSLAPLFDALEPFTPLSSEIRRCILSEEEIADDASSNLKRIRREKLSTSDKIHAQLLSMVNGSCRSYLQDAVITQRNNRYCIPVKAEYKAQVPGMVHDQSSTGSTFFIEPSAVVALNNRLKELDTEEKDEIDVILAGLSAQTAEHSSEILEDCRLMTLLDFIFAKASLALTMNGSRPLFNEEYRINIRKGRHPLIDKKSVVPIDIHLGKDFDLLVITGPNTGGKTVSLKTVGLFTLMGQAGLQIPALDRSELSVFREVYADIGDEQSIEQSLSTFSSHMTNIVRILKNAQENSLCLFDELGAGTDPTEGAALAIAILNYLHERGIRTMATTHYSELKVYALSTDFVENACCEFNVETLRPTYRLLIGIPGKSNAFAISRRLGLPEYIIDAARLQISEEKESFEDLIADLESSKVTIEKEEAEIRSYKEEIEALKKKLEAKQEKLDASREKILQEAHAQARDILQDAKDTADETIRAFQKAGPGASMKELEASRQKLRKKIDDKNSKLSLKNTPKPDTSKALKASDLKLGDSVKILSMGLKGTVSSLPDHKGSLFVQCGIIRTQTNINDLIRVQENDVTGPSGLRTAKTSTGKMKMSKSLSISTEINLLGMTTDEALSQLDKYLDDAYLAHLPSVRIVHGKGTGALRNAVQRHLKQIRYVESFRLGEFGEGDAGVTIATFKK
ncbi:MAG: endonuclease MutS2 [Lachnospiraceae bacterium]|nr:endonuclease MutS2 [Lachnospiraceae bacterium]